MQAFQYDGATIGVKELPIPKPAPGQVLIAVEAAGLCHSDCTIVNGKANWVSKTPITLGHEVAGIIVQITPEVTDFDIGDRVAVALVSHPLENASWLTTIGLGYDGGYAEYTVAYREHLVKIPSGVSFAQAAVATDSISTAYHAVVAEACVTSSTVVGIIGLGGLGLNGTSIAALRGAQVYGFDINDKKFSDASRSGAIQCFSRLSDASHINFDVFIDFAGVGSTTADAITSVKVGGTVVLVGLGAAEMTVSTHALVTRGVRLYGSIGASLEELNSVLHLVDTGKIIPVLEEIPFSAVREELRRLDRNEVIGRLFTCPRRKMNAKAIVPTV